MSRPSTSRCPHSAASAAASRLRPHRLAFLPLILGASIDLLPRFLPAQVQIATVTSKEREAEYAAEAEQNPLGPTAAGKRAAALLYVENDHTHHVVVCGSLFQQLLANRGRFSNEINSQLLISAAAYLYEHPEEPGNSTRQMLAGIRAALVVYQKFLAADEKARFPLLDQLVEQRAAGKLEETVSSACTPHPRASR